MRKKVRYCFVQDESSHWYLIPVSKRKRFVELNELDTDESADQLNIEFERYLTGGGYGHINFTDPKVFR